MSSEFKRSFSQMAPKYKYKNQFFPSVSLLAEAFTKYRSTKNGQRRKLNPSSRDICQNGEDEKEEHYSQRKEPGIAVYNIGEVSGEGQSSTSKTCDRALLDHWRFIEVRNKSVLFPIAAVSAPIRLGKASDRVRLGLYDTKTKRGSTQRGHFKWA